MLYTLIIIYIFRYLYIVLYVLYSVETNEEFCEHETFSPSCAADEVILVMSATYGRLRIGKCIPEKYALYASDLGCSTDVLAFINQKCSGRQHCSFPVGSLVYQIKNDCPPSVIRSYFEVSYTCLKG